MNILLSSVLTGVLTLANVCTGFDLARPFPEAIRGEKQIFERTLMSAIGRLLAARPDLIKCYAAASLCPLITAEEAARLEYQAIEALYTACKADTKL